MRNITMLKNRLKPTARKEELIRHAFALASDVPYYQQTGAQLAGRAGVSRALVNRYFGTAKQLRRAVIRAALHEEYLLVIAQGIASRDPQTDGIAPDLRARALGVL